MAQSECIKKYWTRSDSFDHHFKMLLPKSTFCSGLWALSNHDPILRFSFYFLSISYVFWNNFLIFGKLVEKLVLKVYYIDCQAPLYLWRFKPARKHSKLLKCSVTKCVDIFHYKRLWLDINFRFTCGELNLPGKHSKLQKYYVTDCRWVKSS